MYKSNRKTTLIKPASACHAAILLAPHKQEKKTNGSKLQEDFFYPYPNSVDMGQKQKAKSLFFKGKTPKKQDVKPLIFKKKQKDVKVIPLKVKTSDTGRIRHFTPAAQE